MLAAIYKGETYIVMQHPTFNPQSHIGLSNMCIALESVTILDKDFIKLGIHAFCSFFTEFFHTPKYRRHNIIAPSIPSLFDNTFDLKQRSSALLNIFKRRLIT